MLLRNARILTMEPDTAEIASGFVRVLGGQIVAVGKMFACPAVPGDEEIFDLAGKLLMPGLIDAHSHIGLSGDGMGAEGDDVNEDTDPLTPHLRAIDAINPLDRSFAEARESGVTCVVVGPGSSNPIAGQTCAIKTHGRWVDQMVLAQPLAIKFALGENPKMVHGAKPESPVTRMATAAMIREQLHKAKRYMEDAEAAEKDPDLTAPDYDARCEALVPLLRREIQAHFHAHKAYDLLTAVRIAEEFYLDYVLVHCTEGYLIADILAGLGARAVCGPMISSRSKPELSGLSVQNCSKLLEAGVMVAISTDHPEVPVDFLTTSAAIASTGGLDRNSALEAITIGAARTLGLARRIGSIAPGKDADLLVFLGDPLSLGAKPEMVFVDGERVK